MKVLITGAAGQLGRALLTSAPIDAVIVASDRTAFDITDAEQVRRAVREAAPDWIINAAAYTAVDLAESEAELTVAINADAVAHLAGAAAETGARLVQVSTDFVFDGRSTCPYPTDAAPNPLSTYGHSKLAGEAAAGDGAVIVRTAWVYAAQGTNFVHTMLRLMRERDELRVVTDQIGSPTWATGLAQTIWRLIEAGACGIWHHTDSGVASWYDFAVAIMEEALALGLLDRPIALIPIRTIEYPTPARRPAFSVLDCAATAALLGAPAPHWRVNLRHMLKEVKVHG